MRLNKIIVGTHIIVPRIASNINNLVTCFLPSAVSVQSSSSLTNIVGITNPLPPIVVVIKLKSEVTKVLCFSFHQIDEILAVELYKIGYAIAESIDPITIKPKLLFISTLAHAPINVIIEAKIIEILMFFPIAKLAGIFNIILATTNEREHIVINVSLTLNALFNYTF